MYKQDFGGGCMKIKIITVVLLISLGATVGETAPPRIPPTSADPGAQLNRDREILEQMRIEREIREQQQRENEAIKSTADNKDEGAEDLKITFLLKDLQFSESVVLSPEELNQIKEQYEDEVLTIENLYSIVNKINELYAQKGYLVCRAILSEQSIHEGVVHITLMEGKTGRVLLDQNKSTRTKYIKSRLPLEVGKVSNFKQLNKDVQWFNGTNDVQLQLEIKAGKTPGTTDYFITAYEPPQQVFNLFADNSGIENNGKYRGGLGYTNRSLFGLRDELNLFGMGSEGSLSGAVSYTIPVTKKGTRIGLSYSQNRVETIDGPLEDLDIIGRSKSYGIAVTHPFKVTKKLHIEGFVEARQQKSKTEILGYDWVDDTINNYTAGVAITNYWSKAVLCQRHSYSLGSWEDIFSETKDYSRYNFMGLYQQSVAKNHLLTARANFQWTPDDFISSSDQFYIGGLYSVRGYEESLLAADSGVSVSLEYAIPIGKKHQAFGFVDYGHVFGDNAPNDSTLVGTGIGWRWNFMKGGTALVTVGIPLKRTINEQRVDGMQLYFSVNKRF